MTVTSTSDPSGGSTTSAGDTITYTIEVANTGEKPLTCVEVVDTLLAGVTDLPQSPAVCGAHRVRRFRDEFNADLYSNSHGITSRAATP